MKRALALSWLLLLGAWDPWKSTNRDVTAGNVSAYSSGAFTGGDVTTDAELFIGSASSVLLGDLAAGGYVNVAANGGSATVGGVNSGSYIRINANTTMCPAVMFARSRIARANGFVILPASSMGVINTNIGTRMIIGRSLFQ